MGDNELQVKVGETVRLFVGNGGPNLTSSFHVIGEIFDKVYMEGGTTIMENVQTPVIPDDVVAWFDFKANVHGVMCLLDERVLGVFAKGLWVKLKVVGEKSTTL